MQLLARSLAAESMVLLKNVGNTLPLLGSSEEPVPAALFGVGQVYTVKGGTGSGNVNNLKTISLLEGMGKLPVPEARRSSGTEIPYLVPVSREHVRGGLSGAQGVL